MGYCFMGPECKLLTWGNTGKPVPHRTKSRGECRSTHTWKTKRSEDSARTKYIFKVTRKEVLAGNDRRRFDPA